jgi:hypothetical protein
MFEKNWLELGDGVSVFRLIFCCLFVSFFGV